MFYKFDREITFNDIKKFNYPNQRIGVIIHIENDERKILLQQRGPKSSDEQGLYEDVGGKYETKDATFKDTIIRELKEEVGEEAIIDISSSVGIMHIHKRNINWIFIIYCGKYIKGQLKIMEPEKCIGYNFFDYNELMSSELVTESCKELSKSLQLIKTKKIV